MNAAERFGANLQSIRAKSGISQEELANLSSVHRTQVGDLERGVGQPRLETIVKLAGGLGVDPCELIYGIRWVPAASTKTGEFEIA
ncbi:MAG TPA: helix-turn-helix transcriptional regulator [Solirubrobacterales bacterium]